MLRMREPEGRDHSYGQSAERPVRAGATRSHTVSISTTSAGGDGAARPRYGSRHRSQPYYVDRDDFGFKPGDTAVQAYTRKLIARARQGGVRLGDPWVSRVGRHRELEGSQGRMTTAQALATETNRKRNCWTRKDSWVVCTGSRHIVAIERKPLEHSDVVTGFAG